MTEATEPGTGTYNRSHQIRYRLPLRDDLSIDRPADETQYHLSPNWGAVLATIHTPSTTASPSGPFATVTVNELGQGPIPKPGDARHRLVDPRLGYDIDVACALLDGRNTPANAARSSERSDSGGSP